MACDKNIAPVFLNEKDIIRWKMEIPGTMTFYPESFRDAREAQRLFFSVESFNEFMTAVERKSKPRGNMVPMGGGDDDIMMEQPDNYDNL